MSDMFGQYPTWMLVLCMLGALLVFASECSGRNDP